MTTPLATIADALIEFILSLLRDPEAAAEFEQDPEGTLAANGLSDVCADDVRAVKVAVRGDDELGRHARRALKRVDILREAPAQYAARMQLGDKVVRRRGREIVGPQLGAQTVEGVGLLSEIREGEDGLRVGQIVLLQIVVEAGARRPKVGDAGRDRDAGAAHDDDVLALLGRNVLCDAGEVKALQQRRATRLWLCSASALKAAMITVVLHYSTSGPLQ